MRTLLLPFCLALASVAAAQDRASVEKFAQDLNAAGNGNDVHWILAHLEPTMIVRSDGNLGLYKEYADYVATVDKTPKKDLPKPNPSGKMILDACDIRGERAIVDMTSSWTDQAGKKAAHSQKIHAVLVWKGSEWRFWRLDIGPVL